MVQLVISLQFSVTFHFRGEGLSELVIQFLISGTVF